MHLEYDAKQTFRSKYSFYYFQEVPKKQIHCKTGGKNYPNHKLERSQDVTWPVMCTLSANFISLQAQAALIPLGPLSWLCLKTDPLKDQKTPPLSLILASP